MALQPFSAQNYDLSTKSGQTRFQKDLATFLNGLLAQVQNSNWLASRLWGNLAINQALGAVSSNQSVDGTNASIVMVSLSSSASINLALPNLAVGVPVVVRIAASANITFKMSGTNPSGTAYAIQAESGGTETNMVTTGVSLTSGQTRMLMGNSATETGVPTLWLLFG